MSAAPAVVRRSSLTELWPHQHRALLFARERQAAMLNIGMGGGKSLVAIALAEEIGAQNILILCPKSVVGVWPREAEAHAARTYQAWAGQVHGARGPLSNPSIQRRAGALRAEQARARTFRRPFMAAVNFESAWQGDMGATLMTIGWDLVVIDESHRIKAPGGKASRWIARLTARTRANGGRVLALTGTSMPHSPLDLYAQYRALDQDIFGTSAASFRARYGAKKILRVDQRSGEPIYLTGPRGEPIYDGLRDDRVDEFNQRAGRIMFRVPQEQLDRYLGLGDPVESFRSIDLDPATRRAYRQLEKDLIAELDQGVVTAANRMVLTTRLAQLSGGFAKTPDGDIIHLADRPEKARLLADVLEDLPAGEQVVVFCRFHHDLNAIEAVARETGRRYRELSGRRRDALTQDARLTPEAELAGVQLQAGSVGIDLTRARTAIYYSLSWSLADYQQSVKRLHRHGQRRQVRLIHLLADDTIDQTTYWALRHRRDAIQAVLERLTTTKEHTP